MTHEVQLYYCSICDRDVGAPGWETHIASPQHARHASKPQPQRQPDAYGGSQVKKSPESPNIPPLGRLAPRGSTYCGLCTVEVDRHLWARHVGSRGHQNRVDDVRRTLDEAEKDKNGLAVTGTLDIGYIHPQAAERGVIRYIFVRPSLESRLLFESGESDAVLVQAYFASIRAGRSYRSGFSVKCADIHKPISVTRPATIQYNFQRHFLGRYGDHIEMIFQNVHSKERFMIRRRVDAIVGDEDEHDKLKASAPYVQQAKPERQPETCVVEGVPPPSLKNRDYQVTISRLPQAPVPHYIAAIPPGATFRQQLAQVQTFHPTYFDINTYTTHFRNLLWFEELMMEKDLGRYDMMDVALSRFNNYFYLTIPGLAEKRPSILVGDRILVQKKDSPSGHWYEGHVHVLRQLEVILGFHASFGSSWDANQRYNVRFKLNRSTLRRQHQGLDFPLREQRILFPTPRDLRDMPRQFSSMPLYNTLIGNNSRQLEAVMLITHQPPGSAPFIVFGPPGTGKTITIVESILQVLRNYPRSSILACAPTNSAADLLAERLATSLPTHELFRMYGYSRSATDVSPKLRDYTYVRNGSFSLPPLTRLREFQVVVSTSVASSMLAAIGMPLGHFSHIFVDEAGQGLETETLIPVKTMGTSRTNVILSGDPKQLGPIVRSGVARYFGLETSYLERLMNREAYDIDKYNGLRVSCSVVKLTKNFRCHDAILKFSNDRFYNGDLIPAGSSSLIDTYLEWQFLPKPDFPVIFHAVSGKDDREASSPSFFNVDEVLQVKSYIQKLKSDPHIRTTDHDIGVITPYHAQCQKLRTALRPVAESVKVGSVEEFQGQERKVIIISTVRSSKQFLEYDLHHTLGFVANPRRFNVAVTRAQALLIVIGDPQVLGLDPLWRSFLNYVDCQGGWVGPEIPWDSSVPVESVTRYDVAVRQAAELDMNEFARRVEKLALEQIEDPDANVDRPWRREME
ncbi:RNA helicase [Coprinopsis marcescibilis]|uniref:RNA helicase n=1 Tax=Coprinopsis marcescibilis TaxID=230819 RepID=A0A5C3L6Z8_COPMA|nr:RNA helicase [Coprinopsis marcescibilis]